VDSSRLISSPLTQGSWKMNSTKPNDDKGAGSCGPSSEPIEEIWRSPLLQAIGTLRSTGQVWCADECAKLHDLMHKWAPTIRNEVDIWKALLAKLRIANRTINHGEAQLRRTIRQMAAFGIVRCPNRCFEQEAGNGIFEISPPHYWGVMKCPVCDGLGVVSRIGQPRLDDTSD
jgi:hypothetical protein